VKKFFPTLILLEILIVIFSIFCGYFITNFGQSLNVPVFNFLFFVSGVLMGLEFPLAGRLYSGNKTGIGTTAGVLYACDLLGGWFAGIFAGVVFLPLLGLFNTCLLIVAFKLSSLSLLIGDTLRAKAKGVPAS
jgi:spermidine synthase